MNYKIPKYEVSKPNTTKPRRIVVGLTFLPSIVYIMPNAANGNKAGIISLK